MAVFFHWQRDRLYWRRNESGQVEMFSSEAWFYGQIQAGTEAFHPFCKLGLCFCQPSFQREWRLSCWQWGVRQFSLNFGPRRCHPAWLLSLSCAARGSAPGSISHPGLFPVLGEQTRGWWSGIRTVVALWCIRLRGRFCRDYTNFLSDSHFKNRAVSQPHWAPFFKLELICNIILVSGI